ncbi:Transposase and inactivated derivatives%2C IS30 family [Mycobacteroides abscessus]|uniref:helix-turn-helix domain-containing protein n=1 Tax=Mycobacteroides abscessus TaxID=36809 RepID=UPI0005E56053|nr:helix-turn-helix domain-containing protein [Mycobacteroides abscessus]CPT94419.1 Transposase and inactivated derivatives%2C IS30 family [Mycobacteroides abscessus]CPW13522.1 Transposase and inactivated derivatives%2C IS30 family [Mycobacteroides abscessus]CQA05045.1 Transposase and inactivated derivatives%2C IS30 family [Mycobacteroides abscessus]
MSHAHFGSIQERVARVATLSRGGYTDQEIAVKLGVSDRTVLRDRKAAGLPVTPTPAPLTEEERATALRLLEDGANYREVARTIGRGRTTIKRAFPGYSWTQAQKFEYRMALRALNAISTKPRGVFA